MLNRNKNNFLVYFIVSVTLHFLVFFIVFYQKQNKQLFLQVPLEVSFYSPAQDFKKKGQVTIKSPVNKIEKKIEPKKEEPKKKEEEIKKEEIKKEEIKKEDIVLNSKKKEEETVQKESVKEKIVPKEQSKEETTEQTQQQDVPNFMPNKGIMLENADFKYSYYTTAIVKKISRYWQWSNSYSSYRAVIYFRIEKDGFVKFVEIKESSGDEGFDENALRSVQLASPFAPLPDGYNQEHLGVYFEFKFR